MNDNLKKLTGKNPKDFEPVAYNLINNIDVELFKELVNSEDYLFDFVKQNVSNRLEKVCNKSNYLNLIPLLKYYSPSYEDFIIKVLTSFADEDLTDKMLEIFENGTEEEKTYCAKYFSIIKDPLALDFLKEHAFSQNSFLSTNCITALASFGDKEIYNIALNKLNSDDEFQQLEGVKFLVSYGDVNALNDIIKIVKTSSLAENIAVEIPYLTDLFNLIKTNTSNGLYILNLIINSLGEISSPAQVFDFKLYEIIEFLINNNFTSQIAVILLNAKDKFNTLTENDEYLFDESKDVKQEIFDIKSLLDTVKEDLLIKYTDEELDENSLFIYNALDFTHNPDKVRNLLSSKNQTIILKSVEILKKLGVLTPEDKKLALKHISNDNIRKIIEAI